MEERQNTPLQSSQFLSIDFSEPTPRQKRIHRKLILKMRIWYFMKSHFRVPISIFYEVCNVFELPNSLFIACTYELFELFQKNPFDKEWTGDDSELANKLFSIYEICSKKFNGFYNEIKNEIIKKVLTQYSMERQNKIYRAGIDIIEFIMKLPFCSLSNIFDTIDQQFQKKTILKYFKDMRQLDQEPKNLGIYYVFALYFEFLSKVSIFCDQFMTKILRKMELSQKQEQIDRLRKMINEKMKTAYKE